MRNPASDRTAPVFLDRWSPKSFSPKALPDDVLAALFDAARWAPSSFNEQPWRFVYSMDPDDRDRIAGVLGEKNREWAGRAPHLAILFSKRVFSRNGKPNRSAELDAGSAWMSFALQARMLDVYTHAMAGFDPAAASELTGLDPDEFKPMCVIAFGCHGDEGDLPEGVDERTDQSDRKGVGEIAVRLGALTG